jgi:hypothetical protein
MNFRLQQLYSWVKKFCAHTEAQKRAWSLKRDKSLASVWSRNMIVCRPNHSAVTISTETSRDPFVVFDSVLQELHILVSNVDSLKGLNVADYRAVCVFIRQIVCLFQRFVNLCDPYL